MEQTGFWWILGISAVFGVLHSTLASVRAKDWVAHKFGKWAETHYRLGYVLFAGVTSLAYFASYFLFPDKVLYRVQAPWMYLMLALQALSAIGFLVALFQTSLLQFSGLAVVLGRAAAEEHLRTTGFYRCTRHPLYLFALTALWLLPFMSWNLLALAIGVTMYTLIGSLLEERRLARQFGQEYTDYQRKTPWLIPNPFKCR